MRGRIRRRLARDYRERQRQWLVLLLNRDYRNQPALTPWEREALDRWIISARATRK